MADREQLAPRPAIGAHARQEGEIWTTILSSDPSHSPEAVWRALTDPAVLCDWAPFDAAAILGSAATAQPGASLRPALCGPRK